MPLPLFISYYYFLLLSSPYFTLSSSLTLWVLIFFSILTWLPLPLLLWLFTFSYAHSFFLLLSHCLLSCNLTLYFTVSSSLTLRVLTFSYSFLRCLFLSNSLIAYFLLLSLLSSLFLPLLADGKGFSTRCNLCRRWKVVQNLFSNLNLKFF
jgi:hypothetical protein